MIRRDALVRAGLVQYYTKVIQQNKTSDTDPVVYANIPWRVAHLALENAQDEKDSDETKTKILKNITCFNRGLLGYLIGNLNSFTY